MDCGADPTLFASGRAAVGSISKKAQIKKKNANNVTETSKQSLPDSVEPAPGTSTSTISQPKSINREKNNKTNTETNLTKSTHVRDKVNNELTKTEKDALDKCIIKMIATDYQPLSFVENVGFLEYTRKLHASYTPPSRKTLSTVLLPQFYTDIQTKVKIMLNSVNNVAVTTDIWSSDSNKSYITVTCHFICKKLFSIVLATREMSEAHTGANIAATLLTIFQEWQIENKIVTIVSDNGANIKNAVNEHLKKGYKLNDRYFIPDAHYIFPIIYSNA
ncbi:hypothetical protein NQ315_014435 [Exocentrus adspersus]|uniref:Uncharacterized protein n=1 Tax=Exocentrus adspersus TaxID=1586481 RepID=A0AAV8VBY4_9CUCU|nr:hypothetical protein NQ315_014435 [Exocentrus adspersus]